MAEMSTTLHLCRDFFLCFTVSVVMVDADMWLPLRTTCGMFFKHHRHFDVRVMNLKGLLPLQMGLQHLFFVHTKYGCCATRIVSHQDDFGRGFDLDHFLDRKQHDCSQKSDNHFFVKVSRTKVWEKDAARKSNFVDEYLRAFKCLRLGR